MSADSCKTADHGKSSGHGVFLVGPQSKQAASENVTTNDGEVSPLSAFNECPLNLVNEDGSYTNGKFRDALSDAGNIILVGVTPKLTAIVHEDLDNELQDFRKYWPKGEIRINPDKSIYKLLGGKSNQARKLSVLQLLSWKSITGVYAQVWQAIRSGEVKGNLHKGNGFYLGGVIVTNKQKQLVYEWKQVYETLANVDEVREAALLINSNL